MSDYCEKCGGFIVWDYTRILLSIPPKVGGKCKDCGETKYKAA